MNNVVMTNAAYHSNRTHLSSSVLKLILSDWQAFVNKYVHNISEPEVEKGYLSEGSYTHALILEPGVVNRDFAFYEGLRKQGAAWEAFKAAVPPGKQVISAPQRIKAHQYLKAFNCNAQALAQIQGGFPEHTVFAEVAGVPVKTRCDYINIDAGYIVDVKTTAYPAGADMFKEVIVQYSYDLSAALYLAVAEAAYAKPFQFFFHVISKSDLKCDVYMLSDETRQRGRAAMLAALVRYKQGKANNWVLTDKLVPISQGDEYETV